MKYFENLYYLIVNKHIYSMSTYYIEKIPQLYHNYSKKDEKNILLESIIEIKIL